MKTAVAILALLAAPRDLAATPSLVDRWNLVSGASAPKSFMISALLAT